jgi:pyruvate carboxylase
MAGFSDLETISNNGNFQLRVAYAMQVAAVAIYNEAPTATGHAARAAMATRVLNGEFNVQAAAAAVLTNATIAAEANINTTPGYGIPDGDIQFAVNSNWNALAGA